MKKFLTFLSGIFSLLLSFYAVAQCSSYVGSATINEIFFKKTGADRPSFIEIKLLDSAIPASTYDNWSIRICRGTSNCQTFSVANAAGGGTSYPWLYFEAPVLSDSYIRFANGFDVALLDENSDAIDYISVNNRTYQTINCSDLAYQYTVPSTSNGTKLLHRIPDATGPWQVVNAARNNTPGSGNSGGFPYLKVLDATTEQGNNIFFTVQLTNFQGDPVTTSYNVAFRYRTFDDTAVSPTHYQGVAQTATYIPSGQSSITLPAISTTLIGDNVTRSFELFLDGSSGANIGDGSGTGTITPVVASPEFSCDTTFVDGLTSHSAGGSVNFGQYAYLYDNPDNVLATPAITTNAFNSNSCWSDGLCTASGSPTQKMTLPSFKTTASAQTLYASQNQAVSIGNSGDSEYSDIVLAAGAQLTTSASISQYKIKNLSTTGLNATLNLAPGEYWIETLLLAAGTRIYVTSPGEVKLFVYNSFSTNENSEFNVAAVPTLDYKLHIAGYNNINIDRAARVQALVYAQGDITVWGGPDINGALSATNVDIIDSARVFYQCGALTPTVNHYQILHDGHGLTCESETVTIMACSNDFDGTCDPVPEAGTFTLKVDGDNDVVSKAGSFINGVGTVSFSYGFAENVTLSLSNESISATNSNVCLNGGVQSCNMTFASAGFKIWGFNDVEIAGEDMVAGSESRIYIQAVRDDSGVCQSYFDSPGERSISFSVLHSSPNTPGLDYKIGGDALPTSINLDFDNNSSAQLPINVYDDAGSIALSASHTVPATDTAPAVTITGTSDTFYVRPYAFTVSPSDSDGPLTNSQDYDANNNGDTHYAGENFNLEIQAVNKNGSVTGNFHESVELTMQRILPSSGGSEGVLTSGGGLTITSSLSEKNFPGSPAVGSTVTLTNGQFSSSDALYSEVGSIKLFVRGGNANSIDAEGESVIGRFIPASFSLDSSGVKNFCGSMTYMGQPDLGIQYDIHAFNVGGDKTNNYFGSLAKATVSLVAEDNDLTELSSRLQDFSTGSWSEGQYQNVNESDGFDLGMFTRAAALDGPYDNLIIGVKLDDPEGSQLANLDMLFDDSLPTPLHTAKSLSATESKVRFGRWFVENAYGPETSDIIAPMQVQYYNGTVFAVNDEDSCTVASIVGEGEGGDIDDPLPELYRYRLVLVPNTGTLTPADTSAAVNDTFVSGILRKLTFSAPEDINTQGSLTFEYEVPAWLKYDWSDGDGPFVQNPRATVSFGLYRGNDRIISWREVGN